MQEMVDIIDRSATFMQEKNNSGPKTRFSIPFPRCWLLRIYLLLDGRLYEKRVWSANILLAASYASVCSNLVLQHSM